jgi:hypothetical protein
VNVNLRRYAVVQCEQDVVLARDAELAIGTKLLVTRTNSTVAMFGVVNAQVRACSPFQFSRKVRSACSGNG